jgi:hypothetical protein
VADSEKETAATPSASNVSQVVNVTLFNVKNLYLLFKPDVVASLVSFNPYYFKPASSASSAHSNKPSGILIKHK